MARVKITVWGWKCERCGHEWIPTDPEHKPKTCPNPTCRSPYWDRPRRARKSATTSS